MTATGRAVLAEHPDSTGSLGIAMSKAVEVAAQGMTAAAGLLFARTEGIVPPPEPTHALAAAIEEARRCAETGEEKVILTALCGHGHRRVTRIRARVGLVAPPGRGARRPTCARIVGGAVDARVPADLASRRRVTPEASRADLWLPLRRLRRVQPGSADGAGRRARGVPGLRCARTPEVGCAGTARYRSRPAAGAR
jgi:hypothetical protein